jgi:hypothetical protein
MLKLMTITILILSTLTISGCRNSSLFYTSKPKQYNITNPQLFDYDPTQEHSSYTQLQKYQNSNINVKNIQKEQIIYKNYQPIPIKLN